MEARDSVSLCNFKNDSLTCPVCGYKAARRQTVRECRPVVPEPVVSQKELEWQPIMVGDLVEKALTSIGITKESVERLTRTAGKPGGCGCAQRQKWLNDAGVRVQVAVRNAAKRAYGL